jgi:hypothetical protein
MCSAARYSRRRESGRCSRKSRSERVVDPHACGVAAALPPEGE